MEQTWNRYGLLQNLGGIIRVPFLIKGRLVIPPEVDKEQIEHAFGQADDTTCIKLPEVQVVREPVIDRPTMKYTGDHIYQVMPLINGSELTETDFDGLANGLYSLTTEEILDCLETIISALLANNGLATRVRELCRLTSEFPDAFLDGWFSSFHADFTREAARRMIDSELSFRGEPGSHFLDGWREVPSQLSPSGEAAGTYVRAMPTRQLHITAGNAPEVPIVSALRAVLTKSAAVIKLPYGATLTGALFSLAAATGAPTHPITKNLSIVYWAGGDESIESSLFSPGAFDRIVVWGNPQTVTSVQSRALFTKIISLNPRYGISFMGSEAFSGNLKETVVKASLDSMIYNQKACTSSLVHYVEGTPEQANEYAGLLCQTLKKWDDEMPNFVPPFTLGRIKRLRRGRYAGAEWYINNREKEFTSGVVVMPGEFDILDHPMSRLVVVRPVSTLENALKYITPYVSTVGIYPEERRLELRVRVLARGASNVLPLGHCDLMYSGMPHDGMRVLSELVDWKNG